MENNQVPYLCGGTFFVLLLQARPARRKARDKMGGGTDGLKEPDVMKKLLYVITGNDVNVHPNSIKKSTSEFKRCREDGSTYIPFNDDSFIIQFENTVKNNYDSLMARMGEFIIAFIDNNKKEFLIKTILEVIRDDQTIKDTEEFYLDKNGVKVTKKELINKDCFVLESFLIAVLLYILKNKTDNKTGRDTLETWGIDSKKTSGYPTGVTIEQSISISPYISNDISLVKNKRLPNAHEIIKGNTVNYSKFYSLVKNHYPYESIAKINEESDTYNLFSHLIIENKDLRFSKYVNKARKFFSTIKTLLYSEQPRPFYDFYVCNDILIKEPGIQNGHIKIENIDVRKLKFLSHFIIISGTGGIGKSMMMRHLFLDAAHLYSEIGIVPVFVSLKNYKSGDDNSLLDFLFDAIKEYDPNIEKKQFIDVLKAGRCILLLDGLDEISSLCLTNFQVELSSLTKVFPDNLFVLSSRPTDNFLNYEKFTVFKIYPFSKSKALELIDKLNYHSKEVKEKFREDLDKKLYYSHREFASNPLLLTIMLMTYNEYGDIPAKRHIFYAKAYETMARLHDATKGAFVRPMNTRLEPSEFAVYFAEFCARTYKEEILKFTEASFCSYMDKVLKHKKKEGTLLATSADFLKDLTNNLCIFYEEGGKYYFKHRSFQEYFCAVYFSQQMDEVLPQIGSFFEDQSTRYHDDHTFDMFYDMIPEKVEKFIFLPMLNKLWEDCDSSDGYWTFLDLMYGDLYSSIGDTTVDQENEPRSFLYNFIASEQGALYCSKINTFEWPEFADDFRKFWFSVDSEMEREPGSVIYTTTFYTDDDVPVEYDNDDYYCGSSWEIDIKRVRRQKAYNNELFTMIESEEFPLMLEYKAMKEYTKKLNDKYSEKVDPDDWFDMFT